MVAAYLGFDTIVDLQRFMIIWPCLEAIRLISALPVTVIWSVTWRPLIRLDWLNECDEVNIMLTVRIHKRRRITIQQWEMRNNTPFPSRHLRLRKTPRQSVRGSRGTMRLSFEDIHPRPKGPDDTDFIISHRDIDNYARRVWRKQDKEDEKCTSRHIL